MVLCVVCVVFLSGVWCACVRVCVVCGGGVCFWFVYVFGLCVLCLWCVCVWFEILLIRTFLKFQNLNIFQSGVGPRKGAANIKTLKIKD